MKRVAITGIGALTPLGGDFASTLESLMAGESGIRKLKRPLAVAAPWVMVGEVPGFKPEEHLPLKETRRLDLFAQLAVAAARMAAQDARLAGPDVFEGAGVIIGSSRGGITTLERELQGRSGKRVSPYAMPGTSVGIAASSVARLLGARNFCLGISNACASGSDAVGTAFRKIRAGELVLAVAGGAEAPICRLCIQGYGSSGALSDGGVARPFDRYRDGFVLSEGACVLVLEEYDHAVRRGAGVLAEITGYGNSVSPDHMTLPSPAGEAKAITAALKDSRGTPAEVDLISAHGTATPLGDAAEAEAFLSVFGERAPEIPVCALKSMTGHMLAASGPLEIAVTAVALRDGLIPPTVNIREKDPPWVDVCTRMRKANIRTALSNSFGFGGLNTSIVLKKA